MANQTPTEEELYALLPRLSKDICNMIHTYIGTPFIVSFNVIIGITPVVNIPAIESTFGVLIDWGDGSHKEISNFETNIKHVYIISNMYSIHFYGDITNIAFYGMSSHLLTEVSQWGNLRLLSGKEAFDSCENLKITARDTPNLANTSDLSYMFNNCHSLEGDFSRWDVSNVTKISGMFRGCRMFNSDLSRWDVSKVTDMSNMFSGCKSFNSDISSWNVSNVEYMICMFYYCSSFNSIFLSKWDVNNAKDSFLMFDSSTSEKQRNARRNILN